MINVTKTYLPDFDAYTSVLKRSWDKGWITNHGDLLQELEAKLKEQLSIKNLLFTCNGTIVLQMALKVLNITKEVITTPFSYVATSNAILWEGCKPVFVDIDPNTYCIDASKIEQAITADTQAILATHVYGIPCDVKAIDALAKKYSLKVIYDGAHAFGAMYEGKSLLSYGDISTCSFHATKLFHTVEGGCIICSDDVIYDKLKYYRQFGHIYDDYKTIGINAKNSEFHAAMGLCVLPEVSNIIAARKEISDTYDAALRGLVQRPKMEEGLQYNYSYYPVILHSEQQLLAVVKELLNNNIQARRYFYPSLNELPFIKRQSCPISEDISRRVLCLPLYFGLAEEDVSMVIQCVLRVIG